MNHFKIPYGVFLLSITAVACSSCENIESDRIEKIKESNCYYVGNVSSIQYCKITFTQLLSRPEVFEGQRVMIKGWVTQEEGVVSIFPTLEAADSGELNSSILVVSGKAREKILEIMNNSETSKPRYLSIGGFFNKKKISVEPSSPQNDYRFGFFYKADELRP